MSMRFEEQEQDTIVAEINITPLTDIFLVLLIIFMVTSSAMLENGLQVKLPTAKTTTLSPSSSGKPIYVTIGSDGRLSVNEAIVGEEQMVEALRAAVASSADKTVIIRGDESIVLGKAVKIMDAARSAGAEKIALATQTPSK